MTKLLLDPYFRINGWIYRGILRVLMKISLNLISLLKQIKIWGFKIIEGN